VTGISPIGIITGLEREARCLTPPAMSLADCDGSLVPPVLYAAVGGNAAQIRQSIQLMVDLGCRGILSFGIAAGLDRILKPGDLVLAGTVELPTGDLIRTNAAWRQQLRQMAKIERIKVEQGPVIGLDDVISSSLEKVRLHAATAAMAADMESHIVAFEARKHGLPFMVVRAIADPFDHEVPWVAWDALTPTGKPKVGQVLGRLALRPYQLPALIRIALDSRKAMKGLEALGSLDGGRFGFIG